MAFGGLMWSSWDWEHRDVQELYKAYKHQVNRDLEEWRRARFLVTHIINISGKQSKRDIKPYEVLRLPGDTLKDRKVAKFKKLSREEVRAVYNQSGIYLEEYELDRIFNGKK